MICPNCGTRLPEGSKFCFRCGTKLAVPNVEKQELNTKRNRLSPMAVISIVLVLIMLLGGMGIYEVYFSDKKALGHLKGRESFKYDEETKTLTILSEDAMFDPGVSDHTDDSNEGMESDTS